MGLGFSNNSLGVEGGNSFDGSAFGELNPDHPDLNGGYPSPWTRSNGNSEEEGGDGKKVAPVREMTYDSEEDGSFHDWAEKNKDKIQYPSGHPPDQK